MDQIFQLNDCHAGSKKCWLYKVYKRYVKYTERFKVKE